MFKNIVPAAVLLLTPLRFLEATPVHVDPDASDFRVEVSATAHSFDVLLDSYATVIELDDSGELVKAEFSFDCAALDSDNKKRDKKMLGWLEAESMPKISFSLKEVKKEGASLVGIGDLSMHGVTKEISIPFSMTKEGSQVTLEGSATVDHQEYGLEIITMFFFKVDPKLEISFKLVGTLDQ